MEISKRSGKAFIAETFTATYDIRTGMKYDFSCLNVYNETFNDCRVLFSTMTLVVVIEIMSLKKRVHNSFVRLRVLKP